MRRENAKAVFLRPRGWVDRLRVWYVLHDLHGAHSQQPAQTYGPFRRETRACLAFVRGVYMYTARNHYYGWRHRMEEPSPKVTAEVSNLAGHLWSATPLPFRL